MTATGRWFGAAGGVFAAAVLTVAAAVSTSAQTPSPALLVLEKSDNAMAMVDPGSMKVVARVPAGTDPHEIVASTDGRVAYISNYGGTDSDLHTISVVDLLAHKELPAIDLGALRSAHGLFYAGDKLYFTVETNKAFGRYDPAAKSIDWVLGTGQDRTHMVYVFEDLQRVVTSNVNSATISIIEHVDGPSFGPPPAGAAAGAPPPRAPGMPPGAARRKTWRVTNIPAGKGVEGFDVSPDGKEIWAANAGDGTVTIIDVASKKATQTMPISVVRANRLKFTPDGKLVLISGLGGGPDSNGAGNVEIVDAATHQQVKSFNLGGGSGGILMVPDGSKAFVAVSEKNKVVAIDLKELKVIGEIPTGKNPDGLAWAQQR